MNIKDKYDSIIFDLDGTLWNSSKPICEAWNIILKRHKEITLHIKGQGIYTLVELYSENDFYDYDRCKIDSDLIVKKKNIYKDGIYYMKFLLKGTDDDVRENL